MPSIHQKQYHIHVIIDVFRAFSTASYILAQKPKQYILTNTCHIIQKLKNNDLDSIIIGKPEKGSDLQYNIPNSPTYAKELNLYNKYIYHRTAAGATGVLNSTHADLILCAGFNNLSATIRYIKQFKNAKIKIKPMGHEANNPSLEDDLCADSFHKRLQNYLLKTVLPIEKLKNTTGKYFFQNHYEYPHHDFLTCLSIDTYDFVIIANSYKDYALLRSKNV